MITGIGWFFGGEYAAALCFIGGALLIISGLITPRENSAIAGGALVDSTTNQPFITLTNMSKWRKLGFVLSTILLLALVIYGAFQYFKEPADILIRQIDIGWHDSGDRVIVQGTDYALPGKQWVANIHYTSSKTQDVIVAYASFFPSSIPQNADSRNDLEDMEWERVVSVLAHNDGKTKMKAVANAPTFATLFGPTLSQQQLEDMMNRTTAVYFMAIFAARNELWKRSWKPHAEVCVYRDGIAPIVHYCHDHNGP